MWILYCSGLAAMGCGVALIHWFRADRLREARDERRRRAQVRAIKRAIAEAGRRARLAEAETWSSD